MLWFVVIQLQLLSNLSDKVCIGMILFGRDLGFCRAAEEIVYLDSLLLCVCFVLVDLVCPVKT